MCFRLLHALEIEKPLDQVRETEMLSSMVTRGVRIWTDRAAADGQKAGRKTLQSQDLNAMQNKRQGRVKVEWCLPEIPRRRE